MDPQNNIGLRHDIIPNDPQFLLTPNILPEEYGRDFSKESTNMIEGETIKLPVTYEVTDKNRQPTGETRQSIVEIRATFIKPEVKKYLLKHYNNAGASKVGKIYDNNVGVSFMRAAREIKLDRQVGFVNTSDPTERWWGVEIRFKPELDEIFGVSADKQHIQNIFPISPRTPSSYHDSASESLSVKFNIELNDILKETISTLRKFVGKTTGTRRNNPGQDTTTIEKKADSIVKRDKTLTKSAEIQKEKSDEEKLDDLKTLYEGMHPDIGEDELEELAISSLDSVIEFAKDDWAGTTFLDHKPIGKGSAAIVNIRHKFYKNFFETLENMDDDVGENAVKLLMMAYIRTEDELSQKHDPEGELFDEFRDRWGHWVNELLPLVKD